MLCGTIRPLDHSRAGFDGLSRGSKMGIRFLCPNGHKLNVKADLAGKRAICPDCGAKLVVPAASGRASESSLENLTAAAGSATGIVVESSLSAIQQAVVWYVRPASGGQFGPLTSDEFSTWITGGRVTPDAYLWRAGWPDWRTASDSADELPVALAAFAAPIETSDLPAALEFPATPQDLAAESDSSGPSAEPQTSNPDLPLPEDLAVLPRAGVGRRKHQTPIIVTILLVFTIAALVGLLIWVIERNSGTEVTKPQAQRIPVAVPHERS
jgi:hypothetical protein